MVKASVTTGAFHGKHVQRVFNYADDSSVPARIRTDLAWRGIGQVLAFLAEDDVLLD